MLLLTLVLACGPKATEPAAPAEAAPAAPAAPAEAAPATSAALKLHMSEHFTKTGIAKDAFIHGELDQAQEALSWLAGHEGPAELPEGSEPWLATMKTAAAAGAKATGPDETASAIGALGATCAGCHTATETTVSLPLAPQPQDQGDAWTHMAVHQWAVDAMWAGLVANDDAAWSAGAGALSGEALHPERFGVPEVSESAKAYAHQAHAEAAAAAAATDAGTRAAAYAKVVASCAGCHSEMRGE